MILAKRWLLALLVLALSACSSVPVSTDYNTGYAFDNAARYAWLERKGISDPRVDNDLVEARVRRAVDDQLRSRGLTKAASVDEADVLVTYFIGQEEKIDIRTFRSRFGYYPCWHCYGPYGGPGWGYDNDVWVTEYTQGTLVIDLIDAKTRKLVWHGVAERRVPAFKTPQERDAYIRETVSAILEQFPPGATAGP